ncbi:MAG: DUF1631 family protein [Pseudomonadota bacterium]
MTAPNELLVAARLAFLRAYLDAFDQFLPQTIENAFQKADGSRSSLEQSQYLAVYGVLRERHVELRQRLHDSMDKLLNRSLQTAYSTFRPAFAGSGQEGALSLVEISVFEGELQLVAFTDRFRNEAAEQLRDLNIRIALLFGQDDIKEREGPFRPYLVSRSLADAAENLGLPSELSQVLTQLLATSMESTIDGMYASLNAFLAQNGVAAELPLKIKKSPNNTASADHPYPNDNEPTVADHKDATPPAAYPDDRQTSRNVSTAASRQGAEQILQTIQTMVNTASDQHAAQAAMNPEAVMARGVANVGNASPGTHEQKVDQLLSMVKRYSETASGFGPVSGSNAVAVAGVEQPPDAVQTKQTRAIGPASSGWLSGAQKVGQVLRKFLGSGGVQGNTSDASRTYTPPAVPRVITVQLAQSVDTLLQQQTPATADMLGSNGEVRNLILEQRTHLGELTQQVDEQMTIDVVAMLFEFILRDNQVPSEVRAQLGRLQFLVLKLALRDPTLLTQKWHPVRVLINRIGAISVGLKQLDPDSVRMSAKICLIVETLLNDAAKDLDTFATLFAKLLDDFDAFVAVELRSKDEKLNRAVEAIEKVQSRTLRYTHIWAQMAETLSGLTLDDYLHNFLSNTWVLVIERAENMDMVRAERFRSLVPDLIWSIVPKIDEFDRQEMSVILPIMIGNLREGLALIAWPKTQEKELLDWLFDAHTRALRSINASFQIPTLPLMHSTFERLVKNVPVEQLPTTESTQLAAEIALMDVAVRQLDTDIQSFDLDFDNEAAWADNTDLVTGISNALPTPLQTDSQLDESIAERLHSGIVIEIKLSQTPSRARLSWMSADASNLILNLDDQRTPVLMRLSVFRRLVATQRVRFIEDQPLFERAVQSLLDSAEQMDQAERS